MSFLQFHRAGHARFNEEWNNGIIESGEKW